MTAVVFSWVESSPDMLSTVACEVFEEHHMGASTVRMQASLSSRARMPVFYSTGGRCTFSPDSAHMLLWDRRMLIAVSTSSGRTQSYAPPSVVRLFGLADRPRFIDRMTVKVIEDEVHLECEDGFGENRLSVSLPLVSSAAWTLGLGSADRGLLPSVYEPDYRAIAAARGDA